MSEGEEEDFGKGCFWIFAGIALCFVALGVLHILLRLVP